MLKIGLKGESYVFVRPDPSRGEDGYEYCTDDNEGQEIRRDTLKELLELKEYVQDMYDGEIFIIKENKKVISSILPRSPEEEKKRTEEIGE